MSAWTFNWDLNQFISEIGVTSGWLPARTSAQKGETKSAEDRECTICFSIKPIPPDSPTSSCLHTTEACADCLRRLIVSSIDTGNFTAGILCPTEGCGQRMIYYDIRKWADTALFERFVHSYAQPLITYKLNSPRYDRLLLQSSLRADRQYVSCLNPSCTAGQEHSGGGT
jgi:hypothetical protein